MKGTLLPAFTTLQDDGKSTICNIYIFMLLHNVHIPSNFHSASHLQNTIKIIKRLFCCVSRFTTLLDYSRLYFCAFRLRCKSVCNTEMADMTICRVAIDSDTKIRTNKKQQIHHIFFYIKCS